jgi:hypothetical protein
VNFSTNCHQDFDSTMTCPPAPTSWSLIERTGLFSAEYHEASKSLFEKFHPIEIDLSIPRDERTAAMIQWFEQANELLVKEHPTREVLCFHR